MKDETILAVIPARGGSKGIQRKNVRFLNGKPLIGYAIGNALASRHIGRVVVSTDDEEIAHVAELAGSEVLMRPAELAGDAVPLDPVIFHAVSEMERKEGRRFKTVITMQPTSPLLKPETIDRAIDEFEKSGVDTLLSVVDDRHLSWTVVDGEFRPNYAQRKNRQYLPPNFRETGGILIARRDAVTESSRFGAKVGVFELSKQEAVDIDSQMDWWIAEKLLKSRKVMFRVDGYNEIGLGHIYRCLLLAGRLIDHELMFVTEERHKLGAELVRSRFYPLTTFADPAELEAIWDNWRPNIVINDILDTDADHVRALKRRGIFVVNFEDMGAGAREADLVVNALYEKPLPLDNHYWGKDYYCLREEFLLIEPREVSAEVRKILITFGGTDAHDYTARLLGLIAGLNLEGIEVDVVTGLGYRNPDRLRKLAEELPLKVKILRDVKNISKLMQQADIIFTSAGRTVYEIASLGTPVIVLAQNQRELQHTFARAENGIINLGLGYEVSDREISDTLTMLFDDFQMRKRVSGLMRRNDLSRGLDNVVELIFSSYGKSERPGRQ